MTECVFCNFEEEKILRQSENTITILSNPYLVMGHSLVMPRIHFERLNELSFDLRHELIDEAMLTQDLLIKKLGAPGCDLRQNYRPFLHPSRLKVNHLHFHVLPRWPEDNLYKKSMKYEKGIFTDLNDELALLLMETLK